MKYKYVWNKRYKLILIGSLGVSSGLFGYYLKSPLLYQIGCEEKKDDFKIPPRRYLTRGQQLASLQNDNFDILVIGGGATGCGVALDSVTRGLKTALVEYDDFSSGTSSRSTKLIHGGVRYLQKAVMGLDIEQYKMVKEALSERANLLKIAPHLSSSLPIMLPVYKWWQVPYFYAGIKMYDWVAGKECLQSSYLIGKARALNAFPMLKRDQLKAAIVYFDGQHNDARMNIAIALTAARYGATIANHVKVIALLKTQQPSVVTTGEQSNPPKAIISGVRVKDELTGKEWDVKSKCVINATGAFTDAIRRMDDPTIKSICSPSSGVHIVLPDYYSPEKMGLLDPATSDGRVIFFLPWENMTIAGTTDIKCAVTHHPIPTESEIEFILKEVRNYLTPELQVRRGDVTSAWSGIRPLVSDPNAKDTQSIARNHIIHASPSNLITIAGGKWTTYRLMAEETVDTAVKVCGLDYASKSKTKGLLLDGAHHYTPTLFINLVQDFGIETQIARHLADTYGDAAFSVLRLAKATGKRWPILGRKLHGEYPYIEAEVRYSVKEYACTLIDVIARRLRFAFLNAQACEEALPVMAEILAGELGWSKAETKKQIEDAKKFLFEEMGLKAYQETLEQTPIDFTKDEMREYSKKFDDLSEGKEFITVRELGKFMKKQGQNLTYEQLHDILNEVDLNKNGQIELIEFLKLMSGLKTGAVSTNRFALAANISPHNISVDRSGGGV